MTDIRPDDLNQNPDAASPQAQTDQGERNTRGNRPEAQPNGPQNPDEAMAGDNGQTRQPQGHGMVQPDGGVNQ